MVVRGQVLEREAERLGRVKPSLAYPALLAVRGTGTVIVISAVVVPRFAELLEGVGQTLPPATKMLLTTSAFLTHHGLLIVATLLLAILGMSEPCSAVSLDGCDRDRFERCEGFYGL